MNRRTFFSRIAGAIAAAIVAPSLPITPAAIVIPSVAAPILGEIGYGGITPATFSFWRNRQETHSPETMEAMSRAMTAAFNNCDRLT